jgi:hypothetical protein
MAEWQSIAGDSRLLTAEYPVHGWSGRTTVIGEPGGDFAVYNPGAGIAPELREALRRRGRVALLVAANHFHHLGVPAWREAFPSALAIASTLAVPRLRAQGIEASGYDGIELPAGARILEPMGLKNGEVWLSVATTSGRCWIVGDAFFHVLRTPRNPAGLMLWMTGTTPGLRIGSTLRWLGIGEPRAYRDWLEAALAAERPEMLVPAHGAVLRDPQLTQRLAALARARL